MLWFFYVAYGLLFGTCLVGIVWAVVGDLRDNDSRGGLP